MVPWCLQYILGLNVKTVFPGIGIPIMKIRLYNGNPSTLQWSHNGHDGVSNHQPHHCLLNRLFRHRSKKTSKLRVLAFVWGIHRWPVNSPHKWPVTQKMFPFDDVIMTAQCSNNGASIRPMIAQCLYNGFLKTLCFDLYQYPFSD